jgi:signal transduction histidine kinase
MTTSKTLFNFLLLIFISSWVFGSGEKLDLSEEELEWIKQNPVISYSGDPDWPPYDSNVGGEHNGISRNYLDKISELTGLDFEYVPSDSWTGLRDLFREGKIEMVTSIAKSRQRSKSLKFSDPYIFGEFVIVTNETDRRIFDENDLSTLKISVVKDYRITEQLLQKFPRYNFLYFPTSSSSLDAVDQGLSDATIMDFTVAMYLIEKNNYSQFRIIPSLFPDREIHMAVWGESPLLINVINKALASLSEKDKAELRNDFFEVSLKTGIPRKYIRLFSLGLFFLGGIIIFVIFWNQSLQKQIQARRKVEIKLTQANINLKEKSNELGTALENQKNTQSELVQIRGLSVAGQMSAVVNHEVNNLLNYLKASLSPLKRDIEFLQKLPGKELREEDQEELEKVKKETGELLQNLEQGADHAAEIMASIRDFAKSSSLELRPVNIHEAIDSTLQLIKPLTPKDILVEKDFHSDGFLEGFLGPLKQLFINLFQNSFFAMGDAGILKIGTEDITEKKLEIVISDNGKGFSENEGKRIFQAFYTSNKNSEGTGLGLSIVKRIVENHGGTIKAEGKLGEGAKFTIEIPKFNKPKKTSP